MDPSKKRISCSGLQMFEPLSGWPVLVLIVMIKASPKSTRQCSALAMTTFSWLVMQRICRDKSGRRQGICGTCCTGLGFQLSASCSGIAAAWPQVTFQPQESFLTLIGLGAPCRPDAIAVRGALALRGKIFWRLKDWIDQRFMNSIQRITLMGCGVGRLARVPLGRYPMILCAAADAAQNSPLIP